MNIAIVGSRGYIGKAIINKLEKKYDILKIAREDVGQYEKLELENPEKFKYDKLKNIDYVIFTAAVSSPDSCSNDYENAYKINVKGTIFFLDKALAYGCKILFFSSDAVYGDDHCKKNTEDTQTNPTTIYGKMKEEIENRFMSNKNFKSLRLAYVISAQDKFISYCLSCKKKKIPVEVFHPFYRNCTNLTDVILCVEWLIDNWSSFDSSFLNICGSELVSRIRILDELNRLCEKKIQYNITKPENSFFINRPMITQMNSIYLKDIIKITNFSENLKREMEGKDND